MDSEPSMLGSDTDVILSQLGYVIDEIRAMKQAGNVGFTAVHRRKSTADEMLKKKRFKFQCPDVKTLGHK